MASQKELVAVVADNLGVSHESVTVMDRFLAEAGLRTRALRGRGHTPMTYQDAANLVIASAIGSSPKDAVQHVVDYGNLAACRVRETVTISKEALGETFGLALANMIESVAASREDFSAPEDSPNHVAAHIIMYGPEPQAEIVLFRGGKPTTFAYGPLFAAPRDLRRSVQFSQITLGFVGEAIGADLPSKTPNPTS
jgi:hypothetical protein